MTRTACGLALGLAAAAAGGLLYAFDPATTHWFPPCPFHALTGLHCPGCGSLRAAHALLHGELARAFAFNALTTAAAPLLLLGAARETWRLASGADPVGARLPAWMIRALVVVLLGFAVLRNTAAFSFLAPHS